jgi:hypothetical protein
MRLSIIQTLYTSIQLQNRFRFGLFCERRLVGQPILVSGPKPGQSQSQSQKVTVQQTVSQSVCLGVKPNLGLLTRDFFFLFQSYGLVSVVAPSLTRGRVCHLSVLVNTVYNSQSVIT